MANTALRAALCKGLSASRRANRPLVSAIAMRSVVYCCLVRPTNCDSRCLCHPWRASPRGDRRLQATEESRLPPLW